MTNRERTAKAGNAPCQLYRYFDEADRLLYVGISSSAAARMSQHSIKPWFQHLRRVEVSVFPSREAAAEAERLAINEERPIHNVAHNSAARADWPPFPDEFNASYFQEEDGLPVLAVRLRDVEEDEIQVSFWSCADCEIHMPDLPYAILTPEQMAWLAELCERAREWHEKADRTAAYKRVMAEMR